MNTDELLGTSAPDPERLAHHTGALRERVLTGSPSAPADGRRRSWVAVVGTTAAVLTLGVASAVVLHARAQNGAPPVASRAGDATAAYRTQGAFAVGHTVYLGSHRLRFDDWIQAIAYTSAGIVVRHGPVINPQSPHYTLVSLDGHRTDLTVDLSRRMIGTDPTSPYLAFAAPAGAGQWRLSRLDLRTGRTDASPPITGQLSLPDYVAPPVATDGTRVWGLLSTGWVEWDSSTGKLRQVPRPAGSEPELPDTGSGRYLAVTATSEEVVDFVTGQVLGSLDRFPKNVPPTVELLPPALSPEGTVVISGQRLKSVDGDLQSQWPFGGQYLDLASGRRTPLPQGSWGWTPDNGLLRVDAAHGRVTRCSAATGKCRSSHVALPSGDVVLGGVPDEN